MSASYTLRAVGGPYAGQAYPVAGSATLGRESENTIALADRQLSRRHARFDAAPGGLTVTDLGSANGVYVNGQRVAGHALLHPGDTVAVGGSIFRVEATGGGPALNFAPPGYAPPPLGPSATLAFSPAAQPSIVPPAPRRSSLPLPVIAAAVALLLVICSCGGSAAVLVATRGGDDPAPTTGSAVPAAGTSVASSAQRQAGMVTGRITAAAGQPLPAGATAKVTINGTSIAGQNVRYEPSVDAQGRYAQRVADGLYSVSAQVNFRYNGGTFNLRLHPNDNLPYTQTYDSKDGIVKDFTWKLSGLIFNTYDPKDPLSYYGQYITLIGDSLKLPADGAIEFTFTPRGPLADGSAGQPIKRTVTAAEAYNWTYLKDLPIAAYTVTANVTGNQPRALKVCVAGNYTVCTQDPAKPMAQFQFDFKTSDSIGGIAAEPLYLVPSE